MKQPDEIMEKYIREVCRKLCLSAEMKKRVASDLRTDIRLRLESGLEMDTILQELGLPGEAAKYFNEEMAGQDAVHSFRLGFLFLAAAVVTFIVFTIDFIYNLQFNKVLSKGFTSIGWADGSSSIFLVGKISSPYPRLIWAAAIILGLLAAYFLSGRKPGNVSKRAAFVLSLIGSICFLLGLAAHLPFGKTTDIGVSWTTAFYILFSGTNFLLVVLSLIPLITLVICLHRGRLLRGR